jgi:hypothetical protein
MKKIEAKEKVCPWFKKKRIPKFCSIIISCSKSHDFSINFYIFLKNHRSQDVIIEQIFEYAK